MAASVTSLKADFFDWEAFSEEEPTVLNTISSVLPDPGPSSSSRALRASINESLLGGSFVFTASATGKKSNSFPILNVSRVFRSFVGATFWNFPSLSSVLSLLESPLLLPTVGPQKGSSSTCFRCSFFFEEITSQNLESPCSIESTSDALTTGPRPFLPLPPRAPSSVSFDDSFSSSILLAIASASTFSNIRSRKNSSGYLLSLQAPSS
mmetsp:Transcript_27908/g.59735  ORF Transcript_27908/g.59735 Transcript_27908/m.59735 type:complete len:209 (+) Transcript_27908:716-1342(+)